MRFSVGRQSTRGLLGLALLAVVAWTGCDGDGGSDPAPDMPDTEVVVIDAEVDGPRVEDDLGADAAPDDAALDDAGPDAAGDAGPAGAVDMAIDPDDGVMPGIETCDDACDRYAECDRLDEIFGDRDACMRDCERISRDGRPDSWFDCVEAESCNLLRLCPIPDIEPLGCDEACGLLDACEVELPLPDCVGTCEANAETFAPCAERLYGGVCDNEGFAGCIVDQVFPECADLCQRGVECNLVREDACINDCLDDRLAGDPLGTLRSGQLASCVRFAGEDCAAADACFFPAGGGGDEPVDEAEFCRLFDGCGLGIFFDCQETIGELGPELACGMAVLQQGCPFDEFDLLDRCLDGQGPDPRVASCSRLCEALDVCGELPEGQNRIDCNQGCVGGNAGNADDQERNDAILICGGVDRCVDLRTCLAATGPEAECAAFCGSLDGCGLASDDCLAACDDAWPRDRHAAWRGCVAEAGDACEVMAACEYAPSPLCGAHCERIAADNCLGVNENCAGACDDDHFADAQAVDRLMACTLTAPTCVGGDAVGAGPPYDIATCMRGNPQYGVECLGFCRATTACAGDPDALVGCLDGCGQGLVGDDGLRYLAARDCLGGLEVDATCDDVSACVPPSADADCAALCDRAGGCGLDLAECPARCADDPLARLRSLRGEVCIAEDAVCDEVAACILPPLFDPDLGPPEVPVIAQEVFCAAWDACDETRFFGACDGFYEDLFDGGGAEGVQCGLNALVLCNPFLDEIFDCLDGGVAEPNPLIEPCAVLCEARRFCDPEPAPQRDCEVACREQYVDGLRDSLIRVVPQMQCGSAWSCPELGACLESSTPEAICATQCAARDACGAVADVVDCRADCLDAFPRAREIERRACYAGIDLADCDALAGCEPPAPLPCDLACDALDACGLGVQRCVPVCEDAGFADPATEAQRIACIVGAGEDCEAIAACQQDPGAGGGTCFAWCRATTECDPDAAEALPECLTRCLTGFGDGDALRLDAAAGCLDAAGAAAECADLVACLPAEAEVDCARYCGALDDCRVPAEGCLAACAAEPDFEAASCVADALRTGRQCTGVAACVDYVPPPADAVCRALCDRAVECDDAVDPFLCRLDCTPTPPGGPFQLACSEYAACGDEFAACLALDDTPAPACVDVCDLAADACGLYPDAAACVAECTGREAAPLTDEGYLDRAAGCFGDAVVDGVCDVEIAQTCLLPASCDLRDDLIYFQGLEGQVDTDTAGLPDLYDSPCAGGGGPEQIIVVNVAQPSNFFAEIIEGSYDTAMNLRSPCDGASLECDDDGGQGLLSLIDIDVAPGVYYLFVEGFSGRSGQATVEIRITPR